MSFSQESAILDEHGIGTETPKMYSVILHNDDYTSMEFVVKILMTIFHHNQPEAEKIMMSVHQMGHGLCGTYPYDIALTKKKRVHEQAQAEQFPLKCSLQAE